MLSVIIPTLNEAAALPRTIAHARSAAGDRPIELIVSDCRSSDGTVEIAAALGATTCSGAVCRADSMNQGASRARGDVLLFLHADTLLPHDYPRMIERALLRHDIVGGAFEFTFGRHPRHHGLNRLGLILVTLCNRVRYRWSGNYYGDQAIFVRRSVFDRIGGFPRTILLEDLRFVRAMNRQGRTAILSPPVLTSPRRFIDNGVVRQLARDTLILAADSFGLHPQAWWQRYNHFNTAGKCDRYGVRRAI